jgi:hypothetical protein
MQTNEKTALLLRTCSPYGTSYDGFRWPLTVDAWVQCDDWDPTPECGGGLHGLLWGEGDGDLLSWNENAVWLVVEATEWVDIDGDKVKCPRCIVRHVGDQQSATQYLAERAPIGSAIVGAMVAVGHRRTATVGYRGSATAGIGGSVTAGDHGTATVGNEGTATAGSWGTATAGDGGIATAGDWGAAAADYRGSAMAGNGGRIQIEWYDSDNDRFRLAVGYVGENGIEPNVAYRCNNKGEFVRAR